MSDNSYNLSESEKAGIVVALFVSAVILFLVEFYFGSFGWSNESLYVSEIKQVFRAIQLPY